LIWAPAEVAVRRISNQLQLRSDHARSLSGSARRESCWSEFDDLSPGTFDKVVRSEPLARAPRCLELWVLNDEKAGLIGQRAAR
jgi:hypothetical protein